MKKWKKTSTTLGIMWLSALLLFVYAVPAMAGETSGVKKRIIWLEHNPTHPWFLDAEAQIIIEDWSDAYSYPHVLIHFRVRKLPGWGGVFYDNNPEWYGQATYILNVYSGDNKDFMRIVTFNPGEHDSFSTIIRYINSPIAMPFDLSDDELYFEVISNSDDGHDPCGWCVSYDPNDLPYYVTLFAHVPASE